jgi:hypothetical protein
MPLWRETSPELREPLVIKKYKIKDVVEYEPTGVLCKQTVGCIVDWKFVNEQGAYVYVVECSCINGHHIVDQDSIMGVTSLLQK